jgi:hypothetical protein
MVIVQPLAAGVNCVARATLSVHTDSMNDDAALSKLIAEAVEEARQQGLDYMGQTERAVKAVNTVRPGSDGQRRTLARATVQTGVTVCCSCTSKLDGGANL